MVVEEASVRMAIPSIGRKVIYYDSVPNKMSAGFLFVPNKGLAAKFIKVIKSYNSKRVFKN